MICRSIQFILTLFCVISYIYAQESAQVPVSNYTGTVLNKDETSSDFAGLYTKPVMNGKFFEAEYDSSLLLEFGMASVGVAIPYNDDYVYGFAGENWLITRNEGFFVQIRVKNKGNRVVVGFCSTAFKGSGLMPPYELEISGKAREKQAPMREYLLKGNKQAGIFFHEQIVKKLKKRS